MRVRRSWRVGAGCKPAACLRGFDSLHSYVNRKQQGDVGIAIAIAYYTNCGLPVSVPVTENVRYDLVVDFDGTLKRVQVKTTGYMRKGRFEVQLRTHGGNQSWNGLSRFISTRDCDIVFVYAMNGEFWQFPASVVDGRGTLVLGTKVQKYKVGRWSFG